jgi:hypothetical protein
MLEQQLIHRQSVAGDGSLNQFALGSLRWHEKNSPRGKTRCWPPLFQRLFPPAQIVPRRQIQQEMPAANRPADFLVVSSGYLGVVLLISAVFACFLLDFSPNR